MLVVLMIGGGSGMERNRECLWCHTTEVDRLREISWEWLGNEGPVAVCSDACEQALREFALRPIEAVTSTPPDDLPDYLIPYPEFWGFRHDRAEASMHDRTQASILVDARKNGLLCFVGEEEIFVFRSDGQGLLLYMNDGKWAGQQWNNGWLLA
jgi:hypothetical protein